MTNDIQLLLQEAWTHRREGNYDQAGAVLSKAHALANDQDFESLGRIFHIYAQFSADHDNHEEAVISYRKSLSYYEQSGDQSRVAHAMRHLADSLTNLGVFEEAERYYRKVLEIYDSLLHANSGNVANATASFACLLEKMGMVDEAIDAWKQAHTLYSQIGLQAGIDEAQQRLSALSS